MQTISLNVVAYNPDNNRVWNNGRFDSRVLQLGAPIPREGEFYQYQTWKTEVFEVQYAYHVDTIRVTVYVWLEAKDAKKIFEVR